MQSIRVTRPGGPAELRLEQTELPVPGPGQALVRNTAAGVNYIDVYYRDGTYPAEPPFTPGQEAAGVVEAVGRVRARSRRVRGSRTRPNWAPTPSTRWSPRTS